MFFLTTSTNVIFKKLVLKEPKTKEPTKEGNTIVFFFFYISAKEGNAIVDHPNVPYFRLMREKQIIKSYSMLQVNLYF